MSPIGPWKVAMSGWPQHIEDARVAPARGDDVVEPVVLLGADLTPIGLAPKSAVHTASTPLHAAFSCYLFDDAGRLLLTRRAETKRTWPGVWSNTCCGHPLPAERLREAVTRRLAAELSMSAVELQLVVPDFGYRAEQGGVVEHELCPVVVGRVDGPVRAVPDEVADTRWVTLVGLTAEIAGGALELSPWAARQLALLEAAGWGRGVMKPG